MIQSICILFQKFHFRRKYKSTVPQLCGRLQFFPSSIFKAKIFSIRNLCFKYFITFHAIHCSQDEIHVAGFRFFDSSIYRAKTFPIGNLCVRYFYRTSYCRFQLFLSSIYKAKKNPNRKLTVQLLLSHSRTYTPTPWLTLLLVLGKSRVKQNSC